MFGRSLCGVAVAGLVMTGSAGAQNLVTNGSFETGDLTGWTPWFNPYGFGCTTNDVSVVASPGANGTYAVQFGSHDCISAIQQTIPTIAGHTYKTTIWTRATEPVGTLDPGNLLGDYNAVYTLGLTGGECGSLWFGTAWHEANWCTSTWTSDNGVFVLEGFAQSGAAQADSITVYDVTDVSTVPEPGSLAMIGAGLIGVIPFARRRLRS